MSQRDSDEIDPGRTTEPALGIDGLITFLPSHDLSASKDFYEGVLRLDLVVDQTTCLIFRVTDSAFIGVCEKPGPSTTDGVITTVVASDVDAWCDRILNAGWRVASGPEHSEAYGIYHAFVEDPSGNQLELQRFDDQTWMTP